MTTNSPNRIDQIAALLQETVQIIRSNAEARAAIEPLRPTYGMVLEVQFSLRTELKTAAVSQ